MSISRRGFLGALLASVAATQLPADLLWKPSAELGLPEVVPGAVLGLQQVADRLALHLSRALGFEAMPSIQYPWRPFVIGEEDPLTRETFTDQLSLDWLVPDTVDHEGVSEARLIIPAAACLAERAKHYRDLRNKPRAQRIMAPPAPDQAFAETAYGLAGHVAVRAVKAYDLDWGVDRVRFDLLI